MSDETTAIPVIKTGLEYVHQAESVHAITVIVSALNEASHLVSDAGALLDQSKLSEAEECTKIALTYLATLIRPAAGRRVEYRAGYSVYYGTIVQTMDNGQYMVVPDGSDPIFLDPTDCRLIS